MKFEPSFYQVNVMIMCELEVLIGVQLPRQILGHLRIRLIRLMGI